MMRFVAGLTLLLAVALSATPASADHTNVYGHWADSQAWPGKPVEVDDRTLVRSYGVYLAQDAANFWRYTISGEHIRPYVARQSYDPFNCSPVYGRTVVCYDNASGHQGQALVWYSGAGGASHIYQCVVKIRTNLAEERRVQVMRHETGHCLGLGHSALFSVMRHDAPTRDAHQHEKDAMATVYRYHWDF